MRPQDVSPTFVGDFSLEEGHDTIWVRVTNIPGEDCDFPWAYALFTWVSNEGRELGTVKIHGNCESEVFRLGVGRPPVERTGKLYLYPRGYNLAWVSLGHPWTLEFQTVSGSEGALPELPAFGTRATLGVLGDLINAGVSYAITGDGATIRLLKK